MSELRWTALRHQMLREVARGRVARTSTGRRFRFERLHSLQAWSGAEQRALTGLWLERNPTVLVAMNGDRGQVWTASDADYLLSAWDSEHPEIAEEDR